MCDASTLGYLNICQVTATDSPPRLRDALEPWCAAGATGVLRAADIPGGSVYLAEGRLAFAECPLVCGVDRRLTASGRLPPEAWRAALAAGRSTCRVGVELVEQGHLTAGELELVALLALFDAALLLFDVATAAPFESGATHVLGTGRTVALTDVCREVDRRRRLLDDAWPDPGIDTSAVIPARRFAGHHVALTSLQWEIVANADRRRSPVDLARLLGRDTFATLLETRRLARAGLVEPGRPGGSAATESMAAFRALAAASVPPPPAAPAVDAVDGVHRAGSGSRATAAPEEHATRQQTGTADRPRAPTDVPPLPRRHAGSIFGRAQVMVAERATNVDDECPESTLVRIRQALEALA